MKRNFPELRLVCKALNELVEPKVFSTLIMQFDKDGAEKWRGIPDFLSSLASRTSPYVRWAKELQVTQLIPDRYLKGVHHIAARFDQWQTADSEREKMFASQHQLLAPAIESLAQVERVGFLVSPIQPYHIALSASAKLPRLKLLGIIFQTLGRADLPFDGFSNLTAISILDSLRLTPSCVPLLHALTSFTLSGDSAYVPANFWKALQDSGICILDLKVGPLTQPIIDYLSSYSGLRDFNLDSSGRDPEDVENIMHEFFHSVLRMHRSSMKALAFRNTKPGSWVITKSYLELVSQCKNLESLNLVYHFPFEEDNGPPTITLPDLFGKVSDDLPKLQTLKLAHTRKHERVLNSMSLRDGEEFIRPISESFALQIIGPESHFSSKREPQFLLRAAGCSFSPALLRSEPGCGHYRFDRDESGDEALFPSINSDEGFY
ncbi:hypothetical protein MD484_g7357, partial [Candolleomyces efflorescens]